MQPPPSVDLCGRKDVPHSAFALNLRQQDQAVWHRVLEYQIVRGHHANRRVRQTVASRMLFSSPKEGRTTARCLNTKVLTDCGCYFGVHTKKRFFVFTCLEVLAGRAGPRSARKTPRRVGWTCSSYLATSHSCRCCYRPGWRHHHHCFGRDHLPLLLAPTPTPLPSLPTRCGKAGRPIGAPLDSGVCAVQRGRQEGGGEAGRRICRNSFATEEVYAAIGQSDIQLGSRCRSRLAMYSGVRGPCVVA